VRWKYTALGGSIVEITPLEGVKYQNLRPPLNGKDSQGRWNGVHWCGIFACWVLKQAGFDVRWASGQKVPTSKAGIRNGILDSDEPTGPTRGLVFKDTTMKLQKNIKPGDVCVIPKNAHHFIILEPPTPQGNLLTLAGNSDWQRVQEETHKLNDVVATYRVSPD
jgi:hypothetical protein